MSRVVACLFALLPVSHAFAESPPPRDEARTLETVVVSGKQPGPGMWKVTKGEHVLWILGTLAPLPRRMDWEASDVEATIAGSQELLMPPTVTMKPEGAAFGGIFLIPSLMKARNNPGKEKLEDVLPPDDYARWTKLKRQYLGRDRGVEKRRPILAAGDLFAEAIDDADLTLDNLAAKVARRAAKKHDLAITTPSVSILIKDPKATIREFATTSLDDLECFRRTLDRLETDIEPMKLRANAWALGDIELLQTLPHNDNFRACTDALLETRIAERHGFADLDAQVQARWLEAVDAAIGKNASSVALLPVRLLLREDSYLDALRARGFEVTPPPSRVN